MGRVQKKITVSASRRSHTIGRECVFSGAGLHSGAVCRVSVSPAAPGTGIRFFSGGVPVASKSVDGSMRCSSIGEKGASVQTVEHLLAALAGLEIDDADVRVDGPEIPALDGSALPFVEALRGAGIREHGAPREIYEVREPLFCYDKENAVCVYPADALQVSYLMDYDHPALKAQSFSLRVTTDSFARELAPARTFCTEAEADTLRKAGFGKGATTDNTLVMRADGTPAGNTLRFKDECVRHKALDLIGDLALAGFPIRGHVVGVRSGHKLNAKLVDALVKQKGGGS